MSTAVSDVRATRRTFASVPTPLVVVAAEVDGAPTGMTVGSFVAQSYDPPLVSVSVQNSSTTWPTLRQAEHIGISVLSEQHEPLVYQLAGPAEGRFAGVDLDSDGSALLLSDAGLQLTVRLVEEIAVGDHTQAIMEIVNVTQTPSSAPVVYHNRVISSAQPLTPEG